MSIQAPADPDPRQPFISDLDVHLFNEGNHDQIYDRLGAHLTTLDGISGVHFAVWAPNARRVDVVGNFSQWKPNQHSLNRIGDSGIWATFVPGLAHGELYKYHVTDFHGHQVQKADPYGFFSELPPRNASVVFNIDQYCWNDQEWMQRRKEINNAKAPISVYELHLGSWRQDSQRENGWMNYRVLAPQIVEYCQQLGFTHIELMPISEHPYTGSWGYQTVGYFAVTSRYGTPSDFMYFVDYCHQHGLGVIIDWVPAHFPKDSHGLARFDGTALYEHADPRKGEHPDWDTLIFNYERNEVRNFLISNALFWLKKYHIDGLRVDAVASMLYLDYSRKEGQWIPNQYGGRENLGAIDFIKQMNEKVHESAPDTLTIAEESTAWGGVSQPVAAGGLGFSLKWNMGWMNDTLRYFSKEAIHRQYHHDELTFSLIYAFSENFMLPFSHDEVVHGKGSMMDKMPGDEWQKMANLRLLYAYMWAHPGKKLLFMGSEFGQWLEWNCNQPLQWELLEHPGHQGIQRLITDLNRLYRNEPALHQCDFNSEGFEWIDCHDRDNSTLTWLRHGHAPDQHLIVAANFTPVVRENQRVGVPALGTYQVIFNSDSKYYGGGNVGNSLNLVAEPIAAHGRPASIKFTMPPLGVKFLKPMMD